MPFNAVAIGVHLPRTGNYLVKRKGSRFWWLRLQNTEIDGVYHKKFERSLNTTDKELAEIRASPFVLQHRAGLFGRKQVRLNAPYESKKTYAPGKRYELEDGTSISAFNDRLVVYDHQGNQIREEPNTSSLFVTQIITSPEDEQLLQSFPALPGTARSDSKIIEAWFTHRNISKYVRSDTVDAWTELLKLTNNKSANRLTRDDGRRLAQHLLSEGLNSQTVRKKVGHLRAAFNLAKNEGKITVNPFENVVPSADDALRRLPLDDDDMAKFRGSLGGLRPEDRLLWMVLACTGMRLNEPFSIDSEFSEKGIRYVVVGTKTRSSKRRVPLPEQLLPYLPEKISDKLFSGTGETAGKRIRFQLRKLNISFDETRKTGNPGKVIHSLRHRAIDIMRAEGCPIEIQHELFGHERITVASGYGNGYPIPVLKTWIDKIRY